MTGSPSSLLFTVLIFIATIAYSGSQDCSSHRSCDACIASGVDCYWCNSDAYRIRHSNQTGVPIKFCGTMEELIMEGCDSNSLVGPSSRVVSEVIDDDGQQVTPGVIKLEMRPGDPQNFTINVAPQADFPIDLYILMDLTASQRDALNSVTNAIDDIVQLLAELTSDAKVGFGSFSDKRAVPFNHVTEQLATSPCAKAYSAARIEPEECDATYDFRHRLDFTNNTDEIKMTLQNANLTSSIDKPEGLMDALMQVAVCEEKIGWRDGGLSRRLVLAITDDEYHYALDGRIAAIVDRNDGKCHLDENGYYTHDTKQDYPSTTQVEESLTTHNIIPIFAVDGTQESLYESLARQLRSAFVGVRQSGTDNLLALLRDRYTELSTTIIPSLSNTELEGITITVLPDGCGVNGSLSNGSSDVCRHVSSPDKVKYSVSVEVTPEACAAYPSGNASVNVQFVGFGEVTVNIDLLCSCECSANKEESSEVCSKNGTLQCSSCQCHDGYYGSNCLCEGDAPLMNTTTVCRASPSDSQVCSGRGYCMCGKCHCNHIAGREELQYGGDYCECDPTQCPTSSPGTICSGHGSCSCNGACNCKEGFVGFTCNCPTDNSTCINPDDDNNELCGGNANGECRCGICVCSNYTLRSGSYCELCPPCSQNCLRTSDDVITAIMGNCRDDGNCRNLTLTNDNALVLQHSEGKLRSCVISLDTCRITYQIDSLKFGSEDQLYIYIDTDSTTYRNIRDDLCSSSTPVWPWIVGIVAGIIIVGVAALIAWKCIIYWKDYFEYRGFLKMQRSRRWVPKQNPLYLPAKSSYVNPQFGRKESLMK